MKITINHQDNFKLESLNQTGNTIITDASKEIGGKDSGFRPMELVLSAIGSCSCIDLILILNKYQMPYQDLRIEIEAERRGELPKVFTEITLHYYLTSDLSLSKFERAVDLALNKYCSVRSMMVNVNIDFICHLSPLSN